MLPVAQRLKQMWVWTLPTVSERNIPYKQSEPSQCRFLGDLSAAILLQSKYPVGSVQKIDELCQAFQL